MPSTPSTDILICDALRDLILAEHPAWSVKRVHLPSWDKAKDLRVPRIEINPGSQPRELESTDYDTIAVEWPVMVNFAATFNGAASVVDALLDQVEELRKFVQSQQLDLTGGESVHCQNFEYITRLDPGLFDREGETYVGTFLSVLLFQFREVT